MATQLTSWSFSRWSTYDQCPAKARYQYLEKLPTRPSAAMDRGSAIHKEAEEYLKGAKRTLPKTLVKFADEFKRLRALGKKHPEAITIEDTWAMRSDWSTTTWDDWNGCWVRIKLDVSHIEPQTKSVIVTDFKTGKYRPDDRLQYGLQMDLYALGALIRYKDLGRDLEVHPRLVYLDAGNIHQAVGIYRPTDLPQLKRDWTERVKPMLKDKKFEPKVNRFCGWCDFNAKNGGPCTAPGR